jgi:hypothetical protein
MVAVLYRNNNVYVLRVLPLLLLLLPAAAARPKRGLVLSAA